MKFLLILVAFSLPSSVWAVRTSPSTSKEACEHTTQDVHIVSNRSYSRLLAQLTKTTDKTNDPRRKVRKKGQR